MSFEIKLPLFQGPFDLLLFFIERDELDIYDIPIGKITNDFLQYIHQLEALNMEVAGEFIYVAATLMRIKAKSMLPRPEINADGKEVDPREELVQQLLEYKKFKAIATELISMEADHLGRYERGNILKELKAVAGQNSTDIEMQDVDLFKLLKVFEKVVKQYEAEQARPKHTVLAYPYTVEEQKTWVLSKLIGKGKVLFADLMIQSSSKVMLIFNFLAILELLQSGNIDFLEGEGYNNFWLSYQEL